MLGWTLKKCKEWLRARVDEGEKCPCCGKFTKTYRRSLNAVMSVVLILMYKHARDYTHIEMMIAKHGKHYVLRGGWVVLRHWGFIEKSEAEPDEGQKHNGEWRITDAGIQFVEGGIAMSHIREYNGRALNMTGSPVTIRETLGKKFDYDKLMQGDIDEC